VGDGDAGHFLLDDGVDLAVELVALAVVEGLLGPLEEVAHLGVVPAVFPGVLAEEVEQEVVRVAVVPRPAEHPHGEL
jgi:hypothetical protein